MSGWLFGGWPPPPPGAGGAVDIGDPVGFGTPESVLFIDAADKLAQDPGFFSYDKTTHLLKRQSVAGAQTVLEQWTPCNAGAPILTKRLGGGSFFGTWDPVYYLGFNQENQDPGHGQIAIQMEGLFQYSNAPARFGQEFHLVHTQRGGANPMRFLSFLGDEDPAAPPGGNGRGFGMRADQILFVYNQNDTRTMVFDGNLQMLGGGGFIQGANNAPALSQLDGSATFFAELLKLDNTNHGRLFRGLSNWYSNSDQSGGAQAFGVVNDGSNATLNKARIVLLPIGGVPEQGVREAYLEGYNTTAGANNVGARISTYDSVSGQHVVADFTKDGYLTLTSAVGQTASLIPFTGDPNGVLTAVKGSIAFNAAGSAANNRAWINTNGGTAWTAIVTVA